MFAVLTARPVNMIVNKTVIITVITTGLHGKYL